MNMKRMLMIVGWVAVLAMVAPVSQGLAGGPEPLPPGATVHGPEIWGQVVVFCGGDVDDTAVIRVKRVVDCEVETQTFIDQPWIPGCEANPDTPLDWVLVGIEFFDIEGTPFIKKVKNFTEDTQGEVKILSFDAQFMFWTP